MKKKRDKNWYCNRSLDEFSGPKPKKCVKCGSPMDAKPEGCNTIVHTCLKCGNQQTENSLDEED